MTERHAVDAIDAVEKPLWEWLEAHLPRGFSVSFHGGRWLVWVYGVCDAPRGMEGAAHLVSAPTRLQALAETVLAVNKSREEPVPDPSASRTADASPVPRGPGGKP